MRDRMRLVYLSARLILRSFVQDSVQDTKADTQQ